MFESISAESTDEGASKSSRKFSRNSAEIVLDKVSTTFLSLINFSLIDWNVIAHLT